MITKDALQQHMVSHNTYVRGKAYQATTSLLKNVGKDMWDTCAASAKEWELELVADSGALNTEDKWRRGKLVGDSIRMAAIDGQEGMFSFVRLLAKNLLHERFSRRFDAEVEEVEADTFAMMVCIRIWPQDSPEFARVVKSNRITKHLLV